MVALVATAPAFLRLRRVDRRSLPIAATLGADNLVAVRDAGCRSRYASRVAVVASPDPFRFVVVAAYLARLPLAAVRYRLRRRRVTIAAQLVLDEGKRRVADALTRADGASDVSR